LSFLGLKTDAIFALSHFFPKAQLHSGESE